MLSSEFAPASAVRLAAKGYGGSTTLPAGIQRGSLGSQPVRMGAAANENYVGALPQTGVAAGATPLPLKPLAAVAGLAGTVGAAEFMGPVAGWGVRKTLGNLPGRAGAFFHNAGSVPAGPVNALYQARFGDLFTARGWKQMYANMMGTADIYAHGGHVTMHGLDGVKTNRNSFIKEVNDLIGRIKSGSGRSAITETEIASRFHSMIKGFGPVLDKQLSESVSHAFQDHEIVSNIYKEQKIIASKTGQMFNVKPPELELPAGLRASVLKEMERVSSGIANAEASIIEGVERCAANLARDQHYFVNGADGVATGIKGALTKETYHWGFKPFSSMNPLQWFRGEIKTIGGEVLPGGKQWSGFGTEAKRFAGEGILPKAYEAAAKVEGWGLGAIGQRMMNGRAMGVLLKGGLVAAVGLLGIKLTQHFAEQIGQAEKIHEDMTGEKISAWRLLMNPKSLPPVTRHVRDNLIEHAMPGAAQVAAEGLDKYAMADGLRGFKMLPMVAGQLLGRGVSEFKPSGDFLGSYHAVKAAQAAGQAVPADAYAALIEAASPDVRRAGGAKAPITQGLAAEYAQLNMAAPDVVREIEARAPFVERAKMVHARMAAEQEAATAKPAYDGPIVAKPQPEMQMEHHASDLPSMKVAAKAMEQETELQGRVADAQRQMGA